MRTCVFNPIVLRKAKTVYNFGLSECHRVKLKDYSKIQSLKGSEHRFS